MKVAGSLLLVGVALAAAACGDSDSGSSSANSDKPWAGKTVGIIQNQAIPGYFAQVACGAVEEGEKLGFEMLDPQGPKSYDQTQFNSVAQAVLARNPDGLVYMPQDAKASGPPIKAAVQGGMKVMNVDAQLADPSLYLSFISSDHVKGGEEGAKLLLEQIGGSGKVLAVGSVPGHPVTVARIKGFEKGIEGSDVEYLGARYPDYTSSEKVVAEVAAVIRANPDIKGIYTTNDVNAQGAAVALRDAGLAGKVKLIDWDAQPIGVKLFEKGDVTGLIVQKPREMGRIALRQLARSWDGKTPPKTIHASFTLATPENKDDPDIKKLYYDRPCEADV